MLWDGLGFFGTDHSKLGRLKGEKVNFCTKFSSPRTLGISIAGLIVGLYLLITELNKLHTQKAQTIHLQRNELYKYDFSDAIALRSGNWFYVDRVFNHIQEHQQRNRNETDESNKFREYPDIPLTWEEMTWHDKRFIEEYLCNRTNMYYRQKNYYDSIGTKAYHEVYIFKFRCELLDIANDKIRIHYHIPMNDPDYKA